MKKCHRGRSHSTSSEKISAQDMKCEIVVSRLPAAIDGNVVQKSRAESRLEAAYERIAIVEQAVSFYGTAVGSTPINYQPSRTS